MAIDKALLDQLLAGREPQELFAKGGLIDDLKKALSERMLTDAVLEAVTEWQGRPLDACYPLVFFDAIRVKIRDEGFVRNKAVYIALGILPDGTEEILGIWIEQTEGAKFWLKVFNDLKTRGVQDVLIKNRKCCVVPLGLVDELMTRVKPVVEYDRVGGVYLADLILLSFCRQDAAK